MRGNKVVIYPVPDGIKMKKDYSVFVRAAVNVEWTEIFCYEVKVDMHEVRSASMAFFDFEGEAEVRIRFNQYADIYHAAVRPESCGIVPEYTEREVYFTLKQPENLSVEINRDRFHNLHLFAGKAEEWETEKLQASVLKLSGTLGRPSVHKPDQLRRELEQMQKGRCLHFAPGVHYFEEGRFEIPSDTKVFLEGGAVVVGSFICDSVENVQLFGRGVVYQANFERLSTFRGIRISHSSDISIDGLIFVNPPHYTIYVGGSENVTIHNIKAFSCEGWSDGIDIMSSRNVKIDRVFMRNSDDCIAVYGSRWDNRGDTCNISVRDSVLWADVAHPINIGCHGDAERGGDTLQDMLFENIDILEHHEPQMECMGSMCINVGDGNIVRNICFENIRVEHMEHGRLFDFRIICGKYNEIPGRLIENVSVKNIYYTGEREEISRICGYGENPVRNVALENVCIRGRQIADFTDENIQIGENVLGLQIRAMLS